MFDDSDPAPDERTFDPKQRAKEKADEFRMHAEIFAVFEGPRKFDSELHFGLSAEIARDIQKRMARLEKAKSPDVPILLPVASRDAAELLKLHALSDLSTNDYHIHRRPGELMIVRWLEGDQVDAFYERMQAHFDAALEGEKEEERDNQGWKQDPKVPAYLDALDQIQVNTAERYLREIIRKHKLFVLSTVTADEMDILHLCDYAMGVPAAAVVGEASAPPDEPAEQDRAWFFKMFSLRGMTDDVERMCFFTYLQKTEDTFDISE